MHANMHGKKFYATGGSHVHSDDFFKAEALCCHEDVVRAREEVKKKRIQVMAAEENFKKWTASNKQELERLKHMEVNMLETTLGKYVEWMRQDAVALVIVFFEEQ